MKGLSMFFRGNYSMQSSVASLRFLVASSMVFPWLAVPTSGHSATYISSSLRITAVRSRSGKDTRSFQNRWKRPLPRNEQDRVLWTLTEHGGSMAKSDLARRLQTRQTELDIVLQELESAGKIKLTEIKGKLIVGIRNSR